MKKKLVALVIMIVVMTTLFAGCSMFEINNDRNYHQVVATVKYNQMTAEIYRGDLLTYVASYGPSYIQNYGMSVEQVVEYFYNNLSKQKLLLLYAKDYVAKNGIGIDAVTDDATIGKMKNKEFLSVDELRHCIELTNKEFEELWEKNISSLEKEQEANKGDDKEANKGDDKDKNELEARAVREKKTASDKYEDQGLTDASKLPSQFYDYVSDKIKAEKDDDKKANMKSALNDLKKTLSENFNDYDYFLNQQIDARIVEKYKEAIGKTIEITDEMIQGRYNKIVDTDMAKYIDEDAYESAVTGGTFSTYHVSKGYFNVKSILLKFSDDQTKVLNYIKSLDGEEVYKVYRNKIAFGTLEESDKYYSLFKEAKEEGKDNTKGIKINVSNPNYDADKDELKDAYTDKNVDLNAVLYAMADDIANKVNATVERAKALGITDEAKLAAVANYAKKEAFVDWTYLVNDDPGMFKNESYAITREGRDSSYVEEFTILARELYKSGVGATKVANAGSQELNPSVAYTGETEILKGANGKVASISKNNAASKLANDKDINTDIYTLKTEAGNEISYIVNDYGIHLVMVVSEPITESDANVEKVEKDGKVVGYKLGLDYIYSQEVTVKYVKDENGNDTKEIEKIEVEIKTLREYIKETIKEAYKSDELTKQQVELFSNESLIVKNEKLYKKIVKEVTAE